jgi:4-deoxy-L-threo-5-hexosulose-uronate ketol-isomerase
MDVRFEHSPKEVSEMSTEQLRDAFLTDPLMQGDGIRLVYTHYDRVIIGGANPLKRVLSLDAHAELKADFFLQRREIGIINIGGKGIVHAEDKPYELNRLDCLYAGKGIKKLSFESAEPSEPALFYFLSTSAHAAHPVQVLSKEKALPTDVGSYDTSNARTIYKYIHSEGIQSCQLVMGLTILKTGSVWNTMPAHTHSRRMEAYFYFDVAEQQRVFHFMGQPTQTRHVVIGNHQAIVSPPWSIHSGCGTGNYAFIWGMAGENYNYTDMDTVEIADLR